MGILGRSTLVIDADPKAVLSAFQQVDRGAFGLSSTLRSLAGIATGVFAGVTATSVAGFGIKLAAEAEQARVAFGVLLGSADKARAAMADLSRFAAETPFEMPELVGAARGLLAFGFTSEQLIPTLRSLGDLASGLNIPLGELAEIYGKARVQGRLFMEDINQLTGRGIPVIQELAAQFGVAESQVRTLVEKGVVGFPQLEAAFASLTGAGGKFGGMMAHQSATLTGLFSTMKDTVLLTLQEVSESFIEAFNVQERMTAVIDSLGRFRQAVQEAMPDVAAAVGQTLQWASANKDLIGTLAIAIPSLYAASRATMALSTAMAALRGVTITQAFIAATAAAGNLRMALQGLTAAMVLARAGQLALTAASFAFMATGVGAIVAGLATVTTAFIRAKVEGTTFGEAILRIGSILGVFNSHGMNLKIAGERVAAASQAVKEAQDELAAARGPHEALAAQERLVAVLKERLAANEALAKVEAEGGKAWGAFNDPLREQLEPQLEKLRELRQAVIDSGGSLSGSQGGPLGDVEDQAKAAEKAMKKFLKTLKDFADSKGPSANFAQQLRDIRREAAGIYAQARKHAAAMGTGIDESVQSLQFLGGVRDALRRGMVAQVSKVMEEARDAQQDLLDRIALLGLGDDQAALARIEQQRLEMRRLAEEIAINGMIGGQKLRDVLASIDTGIAKERAEVGKDDEDEKERQGRFAGIEDLWKEMQQQLMRVGGGARDKATAAAEKTANEAANTAKNTKTSASAIEKIVPAVQQILEKLQGGGASGAIFGE